MVKPVSRTPQIDRLALIQGVLEAAGVIFTHGEEPGVRLQDAKGMTGNQAQKARKTLQWSLAGLSRLSGIPLPILRRFEKTGHMAASIRLTENQEWIGRIQSLLEAAGIKFVQ